MNIETIISAMKKAHNPELVTESHVQELWQDGELTITKAGELFRARTLHMIKPPVLHRTHAKMVAVGLGVKSVENVSVYVSDHAANEIRLMMEVLV